MKFRSLFSRFFFFFMLLAIIIVGGTYAAVTLTNMGLVIQLSGLGVLVVGMAMLFARILSLNLERSINEMVSLAASVEKGEKHPPLEFNRLDELSRLVDALNRLTDRDKAVRAANQDPLTGLANRRYFNQLLEQEVAKKKPVSVVFIDLDGFKPINDDYGHDVGDEALRIVSDRLNACVREQDLLARLGGDEFVILFSGLTERNPLETRAKKILEMVNMPMWINGNRIRMGASLGISIYPEDGHTAEEVLNAADESMYAAKQGGKNAFRFYS